MARLAADRCHSGHLLGSVAGGSPTEPSQRRMQRGDRASKRSPYPGRRPPLTTNNPLAIAVLHALASAAPRVVSFAELQRLAAAPPSSRPFAPHEDTRRLADDRSAPPANRLASTRATPGARWSNFGLLRVERSWWRLGIDTTGECVGVDRQSLRFRECDGARALVPAGFGNRAIHSSTSRRQQRPVAVGAVDRAGGSCREICRWTGCCPPTPRSRLGGGGR